MNDADDMPLQENSSQADFDAMLTRALERRDEPVVPLDFATRVSAALPPLPRPRKVVQIGRLTGIVAALVLAIVLFALAPHVAPSFGDIAFDVELLVLAQLGGIAYWLTAQRGV